MINPTRGKHPIPAPTLPPIQVEFEFQGDLWMIALERRDYKFYCWEHESRLNFFPSLLDLEAATWSGYVIEPSTKNAVSLIHWAACKAVAKSVKDKRIRAQSVRARTRAFDVLATDLSCCKSFESVLRIKNAMGVI